MFGNGRCNAIKWSPFFPAVHLLQTLVSSIRTRLCFTSQRCGTSQTGNRSGSPVGDSATAEMSLYRSVRFILHPRVFVPQKFRLRPASDSGIKAVIRLNGFRFRGEPPKCGKNALQIAESHTAEAGTAMAPRRRAAGAVFMLLTVGGLMLNNTPLLQNSPASS